jgi:hypothetical protein
MSPVLTGKEPFRKPDCLIALLDPGEVLALVLGKGSTFEFE